MPSPTPMNNKGIGRSRAMAQTTPPFAVPSSLFITWPVRPSASSNARTCASAERVTRREQDTASLRLQVLRELADRGRFPRAVDPGDHDGEGLGARGVERALEGREQLGERVLERALQRLAVLDLLLARLLA